MLNYLRTTIVLNKDDLKIINTVIITFHGGIEPAFAVGQARKLVRFIIPFINFICG